LPHLWRGHRWTWQQFQQMFFFRLVFFLRRFFWLSHARCPDQSLGRPSKFGLELVAILSYYVFRLGSVSVVDIVVPCMLCISWFSMLWQRVYEPNQYLHLSALPRPRSAFRQSYNDRFGWKCVSFGHKIRTLDRHLSTTVQVQLTWKLLFIPVCTTNQMTWTNWLDLGQSSYLTTLEDIIPNALFIISESFLGMCFI
jgi:hypothetical protein